MTPRRPDATPGKGGCGIVAQRRRPERDLVQLVYSSSAVPSLSARDLDALAASSAANNAELGLTGLLLHRGSCFCGVLEGPRREVFARMEAIATDSRHEGLKILREESIRRRRFDNWSFASLPGPQPTSEDREGADAFIRTLAHRLT
jgi:hypothetical protein